MPFDEIELLETKGKVLDNTTLAIILKQEEIINALNEMRLKIQLLETEK